MSDATMRNWSGSYSGRSRVSPQPLQRLGRLADRIRGGLSSEGGGAGTDWSHWPASLIYSDSLSRRSLRETLSAAGRSSLKQTARSASAFVGGTIGQRAFEAGDRQRCARDADLNPRRHRGVMQNYAIVISRVMLDSDLLGWLDSDSCDNPCDSTQEFTFHDWLNSVSTQILNLLIWLTTHRILHNLTKSLWSGGTVECRRLKM